MGNMSWVNRYFREPPDGYSILNESGGIRVLVSPDRSEVGIQFPLRGPNHDKALFAAGFTFDEENDNPGYAPRDQWFRPVSYFMKGQRCGEEYQGRRYVGPERDCDPQLAAERKAAYRDADAMMKANIEDAMALVERLRGIERGRARQSP